MRPGSSVIELTPYQFETGRGSFVFSTTNSNVIVEPGRMAALWGMVELG